MRCNRCGNENPATNRFCGQCGFSLSEVRNAEPVRRMVGDAASDSRPAPASDAVSVLKEAGEGKQPDSVASEWFSERPASKPNRVQITGPSFLGLGEASTEEDTDVTYLYEDESPGGHARFWVAALMTVALIAFVGYEWYQNPGLSRGIADRFSQIWNVNRVKSPPPSAAAPTAANTRATVPEMPKKETEPSVVVPPAANQPGVSQSSASGNAPPKPEVAGDGESRSDTSRTDDTAPDGRVERPRQELRRGTQKSLAVAAATEKRADADAAMLARADNYLYGRGVVKSCGQALDYLRTAADRGNAGARSKLGGLYATGNCVPLDRVRAYNWFVRAREAGDHNVWVDQNITMLWQAMNPAEKARTIGAH